MTPTCGRIRWREYLEISACVSPSVSRSAGEVGSASVDADDAAAAKSSSCLSGAATASRVRRRIEVSIVGMVGVVKLMLGVRDAAMSATVAAAALVLTLIEWQLAAPALSVVVGDLAITGPSGEGLGVGQSRDAWTAAIPLQGFEFFLIQFYRKTFQTFRYLNKMNILAL